MIFSGRHWGISIVVWTLVLFIGAGLWRAADATTFANRPLGEVVKEAPLIVLGKSGESHADWGRGSQNRQIFTYTEFDVLEVIKIDTVKDQAQAKKVPDRIRVRQPGGSVDGMEMGVPGAAHFQPGVEHVLFLSPPQSDGAYDVLNFSAGKFDVKHDGAETYLVNGLLNQADPGAPRVRLEDLRALVRNQENPISKQMLFGNQVDTVHADHQDGSHHDVGGSHARSKELVSPGHEEHHRDAPAVDDRGSAEGATSASGVNPWLVGAGICFLLMMVIFVWKGRSGP